MKPVPCRDEPASICWPTVHKFPSNESEISYKEGHPDAAIVEPALVNRPTSSGEEKPPDHDLKPPEIP